MFQPHSSSIYLVKSLSINPTNCLGKISTKALSPSMKARAFYFYLLKYNSISLQHRVNSLPGHFELSKSKVTLHQEKNTDLLSGPTSGPVAFKRRFLKWFELPLVER